MKKMMALLLVLFGLSAVTACAPAEEGYDLYATVYPLVYLLGNMTAGTGLSAGMVLGISSHDTTADWSPKQIIAMKSAGMLVYVGANLDAQIDNQLTGVFKEMFEDGRIVKIENEIDFIEGVVHHHDEAESETTTTEAEEPTTLGYDPHFWVSPLRMLLVNDILCAKLVALYPEHEAQIAANHDTLEANLTALSEAYQTGIDAGTKFMMTSTNLYGYLHADYGIETISISPGYHEETEQFTAQHKQEIVDDAILHGVRFILYEKNASSPLSEAVIDSLNAAGLAYVVGKLDFNIMDTVPSDGSTYIEIMYLNLESIITTTALIIDVNSAR